MKTLIATLIVLAACSSKPADVRRGWLGPTGPGGASVCTHDSTLNGSCTPASPLTINGSGCNDGERFEWTGTTWQCRVINDYRSVHREISEEFLNAAGNTDWFSTVNSGTGATTAALQAGFGGAGARFGILQLETGTTNTGSSTRETFSILSPGDWTDTGYEATVGIPTLSNGTDTFAVGLGLMASAISGTQANGCFFAQDEGNVFTGGINGSNTQSWEAFSASGSTRTRVLLNGTSQDGSTGGAGAITTCTLTQSATTLPNTNWHTLRVEQDGTTACKFYVDGSLCTTLTTNIPASATILFAGTFVLKSAGTTNRIVYLDRHRLYVDFPSAMSP